MRKKIHLVRDLKTALEGQGKMIKLFDKMELPEGKLNEDKNSHSWNFRSYLTIYFNFEHLLIVYY